MSAIHSTARFRAREMVRAMRIEQVTAVSADGVTEPRVAIVLQEQRRTEVIPDRGRISLRIVPPEMLRWEELSQS